jgi:hypothetical protein
MLGKTYASVSAHQEGVCRGGQEGIHYRDLGDVIKKADKYQICSQHTEDPREPRASFLSEDQQAGDAGTTDVSAAVEVGRKAEAPSSGVALPFICSGSHLIE